jgi:hypothetical protein
MNKKDINSIGDAYGRVPKASYIKVQEDKERLEKMIQKKENIPNQPKQTKKS